MTTIQDRIIKDFRKNIKPWIKKEGPYWPDWDKVEQFLIQSIKEVEEETRKEVVEECKQKMAQSNEWWNKKLLSITNKEKQ